jgi:hypothetical protein
MMWPANKYISKRAFPMAAIRAAVDRTKLPCFSFLTVKLLVCQLAYLTITYASGMVALIHEDLFSIISATGSSDRS